TKVDIKARVLVPAVAVELVVDTDKPDEPTTIKGTLEGEQVRASFVIEKSTHYRFAVRGPTGGRAIETTGRSIEAEPDQAPNVQLMAPADTLDVTNLRRVELA